MEKGDLFAKLPPEVLSEIFSYELLVPYQKILPGHTEVTFSQGITIIDGRTEYPYPTALFYVDRRSSWLARTHAYSQNRFILGGKVELSAAWLASRPPELAKLIRRLDLLVLPYQLHEVDALAWFDGLLVAVQQYLELSKLHLSLDGSRCYLSLDHVDPFDYEDPYDYERPDNRIRELLRPIYQTLLRTFQASGDLSKLADFFVFYPRIASEESTLEKAVKGQDYDAVARGKKKFSVRDHRLIHDWEYGIFRGDLTWETSSDWNEYDLREGIIADLYKENLKRFEDEMAAERREKNKAAESL